MQNAKDMLLHMDYRGDIGHAFIDGQMIHDNFCNGSAWEIGLRNFSKQLEDNPLLGVGGRAVSRFSDSTPQSVIGLLTIKRR